ncbi:PDZ domain-containing protein [Oceanobacillus sp. J11TS1]|uniref:PDZ domain-containing protein n=1 Tax=Oceanobacillus sp. J11TS1 TaxID=2807191 RepID=UPI001FD0B70D|nr:PDZ domain-containing protein [Oceanobacillus sp. J11TS1]
MEAWLIELAKGIGKFFLNPAFYWFLFILTAASYFRIKRERYDFGIKVYPKFIEWGKTWLVSLISGILISAVIIGVGMVFSYETLLVLAFAFIILSISTHFTLLSPSYTIGLTFLILFFAPYIFDMQSWVDYSLLYERSLPALAILAGLLLFVESLLIKRIEKQVTFPRIELSDRGVWVGEQQIKRLAVVPLLMLVPEGLITSFAPWWPYFSIGETSLGLVLIPFLIGFHYKAQGHFHQDAIYKLAKANTFLAIGILIIAVGGVVVPYLSLTAIILAIIGKEYMNYRYREGDRLRRPYYQPHPKGLRVIGIIPGSPAERLEIEPGESIYRVHGRNVRTSQAFYEALQGSGAYIKMEIFNHDNEARFVQCSLYEGEHHSLGFQFAEEPYKARRDKKNNAS